MFSLGKKVIHLKMKALSKSEKNRNIDEKKNKKSDFFVGNLLFSGLFALNDEDGENGQNSKCTGGGV